MVFCVLSFLLFVVLIILVVLSDRFLNIEGGKIIINGLLLLILDVGCLISIFLAFYYNYMQIQKILGRTMLFMSGAFSIYILSYSMRFPRESRSIIANIRDIVFICILFFLCYFKIKNIYYVRGYGIFIVSDIIPEILHSWLYVYNFIFMVCYPLITVLVLTIRIIRTTSRMLRQRLLLVFSSVLFCLLLFRLLFLAAKIVPEYTMLAAYIFILYLLLLYIALTMSVLVDVHIVLNRMLRGLYSYVLPSICAGLLFVLFLPLKRVYPVVFIFLVSIMTAGLLIASYNLSRVLSSKNKIRNAKYMFAFEQELASLDYNSTSNEVLTKLADIVTRNIDGASLDVLIDFGDGEMKTVYSSLGATFDMKINYTMFDVLLNNKISVVLRAQVDNKHELESIQDDLEYFFDSSNTDACIFLSEGHHIFGLMLLGQKRLGNTYTDYDYSVFTTLYSYFFVTGYYIKNIANKDIVGIVNREIKMSGQIIQSIQQNMDRICNPKVSVDFMMTPAHEIGGEFIDFVRLTASRHLFVLGGLSGKGLTASMYMVVLKSLVRTFLSETEDFKSLVQKINEYIRNDLPLGTFFAGLFGIIDFETDTLYYLNCGTPALFLYTQMYNNVIEIQGDGRILGFAKDIRNLLKIRKIHLNPGDILFSCTAGAIDTHSIRGERFGKSRIQQLIINNKLYSAEKMLEFIYEAMRKFSSNQIENDVSMLMIKYQERNNRN